MTPKFSNKGSSMTPKKSGLAETQFNEYQIAENAKPCKKTQYLLNIYILKKSCLYQIHVSFLGKLPRFIQLVHIK